MHQKYLMVGLLGVMFGLSGCAAVLVGAGVAGGYAISQDSVKNHFDVSEEKAFDAALDALRRKGEVTYKNAADGTIEGKVDEVDVSIRVKPVTEKTVELVVKGRNKFKMPAVETAQEVYDLIEDKLKRKGWFF